MSAFWGSLAGIIGAIGDIGGLAVFCHGWVPQVALRCHVRVPPVPFVAEANGADDAAAILAEETEKSVALDV